MEERGGTTKEDKRGRKKNEGKEECGNFSEGRIAERGVGK
jgi:hypothetical protein